MTLFLFGLPIPARPRLLPELRTHPAPNSTSSLPRQRRPLARDLGRSGHALSQQALWIGEFHVHRKIIAELLPKPLEIFGLSDRAIQSSCRHDLIHPTSERAESKRNHLRPSRSPWPHFLQLPVPHQDSRFHGAAVHYLRQFVTGGEERPGSLAGTSRSDNAVHGRPDLQCRDSCLGDIQLLLEPVPLAARPSGFVEIRSVLPVAQIAAG